MNIEYRIYRPGDTEDIVATISTNEAISHIQAGNSLLLASDGDVPFSTKTGHHQVIRHVECYLGIIQDRSAPKKMIVHVYLEERDRAETLL